jgi:VWFA-related protein
MRLPLLGFVALLAFAQPPKDAARAFGKAVAAAKVNRIDEAILDYREAVTIFPGYAEAWYELGKLQLQQNQPDSARNALNEAIHADPQYAAPYLTLATLEYTAKRWDSLIDVTGRLLQFDAANYPQAWLLNSVGNYNKHNFAAAEKSAKEAVRLDTARKFPEASRLLGLILQQRGEVKTTESETAATFSSGVNLALVRFQFRQNKADPAHELTAEDIEIREDGVPRKIALFEGPGKSSRTVPVELSLLFDCSASVDRIGVADPNLFRETLLNQFPNLSIAIYGFSDSLVRFARPTRDILVLKKAMDQISSIPARDTPLFGSIADTIRDAATTSPNVIRLLVVFSDGESSTPGDEGRSGEAAKVAEKSGTAIFPVMLDKPAADRSGDSMESTSEFIKLASATGGKSLQGMMGTNVLPSILQALAKEVENDYVAGVYLSADGKPKPRKIEVVLRSKARGKLAGGARTILY